MRWVTKATLALALMAAPAVAETVAPPDGSVIEAEQKVAGIAPGDPRRGEALHALVEARANAAEALSRSGRATEARPLWHGTVAAAEQLRVEVPGYERLGAALLRGGDALAAMGRTDEAATLWLAITERKDALGTKQDAWLRIAEARFASGDMAAARAAYDGAVSTLPESPRGRYARYKRGWVALNVGDPAAALADFDALLDIATPDSYTQKLRTEAARDWVMAWSVTGKADGAMAKFQARFPSDFRQKLSRLGALWEADARYPDAIFVLSQLAQGAGPLERLELRERVARSALALGERRASAEALTALLDAVSTAQAAGVTAGDLAKPIDAAKALVREAVARWLDDASKTKDKALGALATDVAGRWLALFGGAPEAHDVRLAHGTVLLELGRVAEGTAVLQQVEATHPVTATRDAARMLIERAKR